MGISERHLVDAEQAFVAGTDHGDVLNCLIEARAALDRARRDAKWVRECKALHRATRAVEDAALAAVRAGYGWIEIGDALGIKRASGREAPFRRSGSVNSNSGIERFVGDPKLFGARVSR